MRLKIASIIITALLNCVVWGWPVLPEFWQNLARISTGILFLALLIVIFLPQLKRLWFRLVGQATRKPEEYLEVAVPQEGHYANMAYSERPISFKIFVTNYTGLRVTIKKIAYVILNQGRIIQEKIYEEQIELEDKPKKIPIYLDYFPFQCSVGITKSNKEWGIKGTLSVRSKDGSFEKNFQSSRKLSIDNEDLWKEVYDYYTEEMKR